MIISRPKGVMTQGFGENANDSYSADGLKGHTGQDYCYGYRKDIVAVCDGLIYSLRLTGDVDKYQAVYQLVEDGEFSYEISYGHINTPMVESITLIDIGEFVKRGQKISTEGNYGTCYRNGVLVTPEEKKTGAGSHLHFQIRKCIKVKNRNNKKVYLRNSNGDFKDKNGFYYEVLNCNNGFNGCIDPEQFYKEEEFKINMSLGERGPEIERLQKKLMEFGFFNASPTGYYGDITRKAVFAFQIKYCNLSWWERNVLKGSKFGPKTRLALNKLLWTK